MKNAKFWVVLAIIVVLIVISIGLGALSLFLFKAPVRVAGNSVLEIGLGAELAEFPSEDPLAELFSAKGPNLWDLRRAIETAAEDDRIEALYLEVSPILASWAQVEEFRQILRSFQDMGKPVTAFLAVDLVTEKELYLVSGADYVAMNPTAGVMIDGLMAEVVFSKRLLEWLKVRPDFIQMKEFKSPETYSRDRMTPEIRQMYESILTEIQDRFVDSISTDRDIAKDHLLELMQQGILTADSAKQEGLVDEVTYLSLVRKKVRSDLGDDSDDYPTVSMRDYIESEVDNGVFPAGKRVAVVSAVGTIIAGRSESVVGLLGGSSLSDTLRRLREDSRIWGVILRIDSPGGSAVGSDMVWKEIRLLEEAGKPVIVSMSGVAGSGGYYIAMGARHIVSQPSTITGSIGVIFGKFDLSGLYEWMGLDIDRIKLAENADLFSLYSSLTEKQRAQVGEWIEATYKTFVSKAAEGRGVAYEELEPKAHGRIYTGAQALELGLVDSLGGFETALREMKSALNVAEMDDLSLELFPKPLTLWERLSRGSLVKSTGSESSLLRTLREEVQRLETPSVWLLAPEIQIR